METKCCVKCCEAKFKHCSKYCRRSMRSILVKEKVTGGPVNVKEIDLDDNGWLKLLGNKRSAFVKKLVHHDGISINNIRYQNIPIIIFACKELNHGLVKFLLKNDANPNSSTKDGYTAMYFATKAGCTTIVDMLVKQGGDVNEKVDGSTYLFYAAMEYHNKMVQYLLHNGADPDAHSVNGPLIFNLTSDRQQDILKLLLSHKADIKDHQGFCSAAEYYLKSNQLKLLNLILEFKNIGYCNDVEYTYYGRSLLHVAVKIRDSNIVAYLLTFGMGVNECDACTDETPLHLAARIGSKELIELLLSHGACLNAQNYQGNTPLDLAVIAGHKNAIKSLEMWVGVRKTNEFHEEFIKNNYLRCFRRHLNILPYNDGENIKFYLNTYESDVRAVLVARKGDSMSIEEGDEKFLDEIKKMKDYELKLGIKCFDFLHASKRQLSKMTNIINKEFLIELYKTDLCYEFPIYRVILWKRIIMGVRYASVFDKALNSLEILCKFKLPSLVIDKLMDIMDFEDMQSMIEATKIE